MRFTLAWRKRRLVRAVGVLLALALVAAGVSVLQVAPAAPATQAAGGALPHYNEVYGVATHNSYWINRSDQEDLHSSGTQELLSDQLLQDHARAIELDVHSEGAPSGKWKVYHTSDSEDFSCRYLDDCLQMLRNFQYAVPQHEVVNVVVELKNTVSYTGVTSLGYHTHDNFTGDHTIEQFDSTFTQALGAALYTPSEFLSRPGCTAQGTTMVQCAAAAGWPTIDQLRGKFIINVIGNWSSAGKDWVNYASGDMHARVAFPIQSVFGVEPAASNAPAGCGDHTTTYHAPLEGAFANPYFQLPDGPDGQGYWIRDISDDTTPGGYLDFPAQPISDADRVTAFNASVFWQLEATCPPGLGIAKAFLAKGGVIRGADSFDYQPTCDPGWNPTGALGYGRPNSQCQEDRIAAGFQMIQTDYPWHFVNDDGPGIPTDPSQRFKPIGWVSGPNPAPIHEPGGRLYFHTPAKSETWANTTLPATSQRWWEATVSTTRLGDTWGEKTNSAQILDDYLGTCPQSPGADQADCTNYARRSGAEGEGGIRVASADGKNWIVIARQKNTTSGASFYQEGVHLYIRSGHDGVTAAETHLEAARYGTCRDGQDPNSDNVSWTCVGSMIAMSVDNRGATSVVTVYSAGRLTDTAMPDWQQVTQATFDAPMTKQGYSAAPFAGADHCDVLIAGPRTADSAAIPTNPSTLRPVTLADLPGRDVLSGTAATIVDLSTPEDRDPPAVTVSAPTPPAGQNGFFNIHDLATMGGVITLGVSAIDASGTVTALACTDNGNPLPVTGQSGANPRTGTVSITAGGTHAVVCTATDKFGNSGNNAGANSARVNLDLTPPTLTAPRSTIVIDATNPTGAVLSSYPVSATDPDPGDTPSISCAPLTTATLAIGDTTVNCTATDHADNTASASFTVHVKGAAEQLTDLATQVQGAGPGRSLAAKVATAQQSVARGNTTGACGKLGSFGHEVSAQSGKHIPAATAHQLLATATRIRAVLGC